MAQGIYHPIPDSGAVWRMQYTDINAFDVNLGMGVLTCDYQYLMDSDTLISGNNYRKINISGSCAFKPNNSSTVYPTGKYKYYFGGLRQDIPGEKVFIRKYSSAFEELLYDFTLGIGDTLGESMWNPFQDTYILSIDSVKAGSNFHKKYILGGSGALGLSYVVEGVGGSSGPFDPIGLGFDTYYLFQCFGVNGKTLYPDTSTFCDAATNVKEYDRPSELVVDIHPNPSSGRFTMAFVGAGKGKEEERVVTVYNYLGDIIKIIHLSGSVTTTEVDISDKPAGVYFSGIRMGSGKTEFLKLIKE